jgi:hypothetical protein
VGHQQRSPLLQQGNALLLTDIPGTQVGNAQLLWALQLDVAHFHLPDFVAAQVHMGLHENLRLL